MDLATGALLEVTGLVAALLLGALLEVGLRVRVAFAVLIVSGLRAAGGGVVREAGLPDAPLAAPREGALAPVAGLAATFGAALG